MPACGAFVSRSVAAKLFKLVVRPLLEIDEAGVLVHREEYYQTNEEDRERVKGQAEIIVAKQRNGPTDDIKLLWQHEHTRFVNLEQRSYDEFEQFGGY